ncbi:uncharacterized protein LOC110700042 isoform X4 [Chenopodium quinoa]|uniref:uncharacterized protein LOC110700042 isoform X4 n=1 Tax=Chenopodium quinoa TaxID=63459 RepID=UPI000B77C1DE|nr:uncharacterized protein LOC110700042 isoform X4 [Chenopodium quinoa]
MEDDGYVPTNDELEDQEREIEPQIRFTRKANIRHLREGNKKGNFIPPNSVAKFLKTNKKAQNTMAMDILEKENDEEIGETRENNNTAEGGYDEEGRQIGQPLELEDASLDTEPLNEKELMTVPENEDLNISSVSLCLIQVLLKKKRNGIL